MQVCSQNINVFETCLYCLSVSSNEYHYSTCFINKTIIANYVKSNLRKSACSLLTIRLAFGEEVKSLLRIMLSNVTVTLVVV